MVSLASLRSAVLEEIKAAAADGDSSRVLAATNRLTAIEELARKQAEIDRDIAALTAPNGRDAGKITRQPAPMEFQSPEQRLGESPRARGDRLRLEFVGRLNARGHRLIQVRGALFKNRADERVGVAYASERKQQGWFLGLPDDSFDNAVLLLESGSGPIVAVCLPKSFFIDYGKQLSRSQGQVKFNVNLRGGHYVMPIPGIGQVPVDEYLNNYAAIARGAA